MKEKYRRLEQYYIMPDNQLSNKINGVLMGFVGCLVFLLIFPKISIDILSYSSKLTQFLLGDIYKICLAFILINLAIPYKGRVIMFVITFTLSVLIIITWCSINYIQTGIWTQDYQIALENGGFLGYIGENISKDVVALIQNIINIKPIDILIGYGVIITLIWFGLAINNTLIKKE